MAVPFPFALRPMLLKQRREPFDGAGWLFEPKWDGWRALAMVQDGRALILSRNGRDLTGAFPGIAQSLSGVPNGTVLDGELVVLDAEGRPDFDALMRARVRPASSLGPAAPRRATSAPSLSRSGSAGWSAEACAIAAPATRAPFPGS